MVQANGLYAKGENGFVKEPKTLVPKVKTALIHVCITPSILIALIHKSLSAGASTSGERQEADNERHHSMTSSL
jgi:hypothetical protein